MRLSELIPYMSKEHEDLLWNRHIRDANTLLFELAEYRKRVAFEMLTNIPQSKLLMYANAADLKRIPGIGYRYIILLKECGCDTVLELSTRNVEGLHRRMYESNARNTLVLVIPALTHIKGWITRAKTLTKVITYR